MIRGIRFSRWILTAALATILSPSVFAGLLPVSVTVNQDGKNFRWTYAIVLPTDMKLEAGNYFTIYDFNGFVNGGEKAPDGWTFSTKGTGPTPDRLKPNDDPGIVNLTWTYNGPTIPSGQIGLGNFWAISTFKGTKSASFTASTARTSDGLFDANITETDVPVGVTPPPPSNVPEPATLLLAGLGLPLIGVSRLIRRRS